MPALGIHVEPFTRENVECGVSLRNPGDGAVNHLHPSEPPCAGWRLAKPLCGPGGENSEPEYWTCPIGGLFFVPTHRQRGELTAEEDAAPGQLKLCGLQPGPVILSNFTKYTETDNIASVKKKKIKNGTPDLHNK